MMRRLDFCRQRMRAGERLVDIAADAGFADQSHMTRQLSAALASLRGAGCGRSAAKAAQVAQSFKRERGEANYADCLYHKETAYVSTR